MKLSQLTAQIQGHFLGLLKEGSKVLVAKVENPNDKIKYRLEAIKDLQNFL